MDQQPTDPHLDPLKHHLAGFSLYNVKVFSVMLLCCYQIIMAIMETMAFLPAIMEIIIKHIFY